MIARRHRQRSLEQAFTLVELLVAVAILAVLMGGGFLVLSAGQKGFFTSEGQMQLMENLRLTLERMTMEMRQTRSANTTILDSGGPGNSDVVQFSIPILCQAGVSLLDANGDVANWGAPLTWGCTDSTCMDADDDCATRDYDRIEYRIDANNQLLRRVLDTGGAVVRQDVFARNITDFQVTLNGNLITVTVTANKSTETNRELTVQTSADVFLRN